MFRAVGHGTADETAVVIGATVVDIVTCNDISQNDPVKPVKQKHVGLPFEI